MITRCALYRLSDTRGNALVVALIVLTLLLAFGLALLSQVDGEQQEDGRQRARESSFQVAEGALNAQIFQLSTRWPDAATPYPAFCDKDHMDDGDCPSENAMPSTFNNVDQSKSTDWTTHVRDNDIAEPNYWNDQLFDPDGARHTTPTETATCGYARPRSSWVGGGPWSR